MERRLSAGFPLAGDYQLAGMNMGWEVTGPLDVAMQARGLGLAAVIGDLPQVA